MSNVSKGTAGEREFSRLLSSLGVRHRRFSHDEQRYYGAMTDILIPGLWAVEVKRRRRPCWQSGWWRQAKAAALHYGVKPVVAYRFDGHTHWFCAYEVGGIVRRKQTFDQWIAEFPAEVIPF